MQNIKRKINGISVGIPSRNEENGIINTLKSLINGFDEVNELNYEIIVYVNASSDNTYNKTLEFANDNKSIDLIVVDTKIPGKANAINNIKKLAKYDVMIFCDSDVLFEKKCIYNLVKRYEETNYKVLSTVGFPNKNFYINPIKMKLAMKMIEYATREGNIVDGAMYMIEKKYLKELPTNIINDDLYISLSVDYNFITRVKNAITYQEPVGTFKEYFYRKKRIESGDIQLKKIFPNEYNSFRKMSKDTRDKRVRKQSLTIFLRVYEKLIFFVDIILKLINKKVKKEILKIKDDKYEMGWEVQSSSKI